MGSGPDYRAIFQRVPVPSAVFDRGLVYLDVNAAYTRLMNHPGHVVIGKTLREAYPRSEGGRNIDALRGIETLIERAFVTATLEELPIARIEVPGEDGEIIGVRHWAMASVPIFGEDGSVETVLVRIEDVSRRIEDAESLAHQTNDLATAVEAREQASARLAGMAEVALKLAGAQDITQLTEIVVEAGLTAVGADGGAVGVIEGEALKLTLTDSLGADTQVQYPALVLADSEVSISYAARTGEMVLLPNLEATLAFSPSMATVVEFTGKPAWASLPLWADGRLLGALAISWAQEHLFPLDEIDLLRAFAAQCAQALDRLQVREAERALELAQRNLSETLQRSLLTDPPQVDSLQIAVRYNPAAREAQIGGDWYDAFLTPSGDTTIVIGDVAGHDRTAAAAMGQIRNVLRGVAQTIDGSPGTVMTWLDRAMRNLEINVLASAVIAQIHQTPEQAAVGRRTLLWSNAGHPPPLLLHRDGTAELLQHQPDLLLGIDPELSRGDYSVELSPGSTVLLYTDGLVERRGERFDVGVERLRDTAIGLVELPVEHLADAVIAAMGGGLEDDVALVALRAL